MPVKPVTLQGRFESWLGDILLSKKDSSTQSKIKAVEIEQSSAALPTATLDKQCLCIVEKLTQTCISAGQLRESILDF